MNACPFCLAEKVRQIKEVLSEVQGVSDSQEYGLTYCQAIDYLDRIESIVNAESQK